jgi:hypothetical protein
MRDTRFDRPPEAGETDASSVAAAIPIAAAPPYPAVVVVPAEDLNATLRWLRFRGAESLLLRDPDSVEGYCRDE